MKLGIGVIMQKYSEERIINRLSFWTESGRIMEGGGLTTFILNVLKNANSIYVRNVIENIITLT